MQAMERMMVLAIIYTAATGKDHVPGYDGSITAPFLKAIGRISDPQDPLYCKRLGPAAYMGSETALGIMLSPEFFWRPLSEPQKQNILSLLKDLTTTPSYDNNHHFFHMLPVPVLEKHGIPMDRQHYTEMLERILGWYRGDGWFIDGGNRGHDWYNAWGFQLYANAVCFLDEPWREQFGPRFSEVSSRFFSSYPYLFGRNGAPIPWGRSLGYRFAGNAAIGWAWMNKSLPLACRSGPTPCLGLSEIFLGARLPQ
jgi:hypothetical protein